MPLILLPTLFLHAHHVIETKNISVKTSCVRLEFKVNQVAINAIGLRSLRRKTCLKSEFFDKNTQKCVPKPMEVLPCPKLIINNANLTCSSDGQSCNVHCKDGYQRTNQDPAFCDHGTWRNSIGCNLFDCGVPKVKNAFICKLFVSALLLDVEDQGIKCFAILCDSYIRMNIFRWFF